jgi:hypothetical protein
LKRPTFEQLLEYIRFHARIIARRRHRRQYSAGETRETGRLTPASRLCPV